MDHLPEHLIVFGGGFFAFSGSSPRKDPDVGEAVGQWFQDEGIDVLTSASVVGVEGRSGERVRLRVKGRNGEQPLEGTDLLAAGRQPNTDGIGLDVAVVQTEERGFIRVNERLESMAARGAEPSLLCLALLSSFRVFRVFRG